MNIETIHFSPALPLRKREVHCGLYAGAKGMESLLFSQGQKR